MEDESRTAKLSKIVTSRKFLIGAGVFLIVDTSIYFACIYSKKRNNESLWQAWCRLQEEAWDKLLGRTHSPTF